MLEICTYGLEGGVAHPGNPYPYVRLRRHTDRGVKVPFLAVSSREVSNRNCVVATQGGKQWNENRQSVTGGTVKGLQVNLIRSAEPWTSPRETWRSLSGQERPAGIRAIPGPDADG